MSSLAWPRMSSILIYLKSCFQSNGRFKISIVLAALTLLVLDLNFKGHQKLQKTIMRPWKGQPTEDGYLAVCVAIQDQHEDLKEFLLHHYNHMNVSHFYIMDDRSDPPLSTFDDYPIPRSAITFNHYDEAQVSKRPPGFFQWWIYEECIRLYKDSHTWMGFIDIDEFLEIKTSETFESILKSLEANEHVGALSVNWKVHTSADLLERPQSVRQNFTECMDEQLDIERGDKGIERHVKSFVKTQYFTGLISPHMFQLKDNAISVGEDERTFQPGVAWRQPPTWDRIVLHHYAVKSKQEFQEKLDRWKGEVPRNWEYWDMVHSGTPYHCPEMTKFSP